MYNSDVSIQKLMSNGIHLDSETTATAIAEQLLNSQDTPNNRESFLLFKNLLDQKIRDTKPEDVDIPPLKNALEMLSKSPKFAFIMALDKCGFEGDEKKTIEAIWSSIEDGNINYEHLAEHLESNLDHDDMRTVMAQEGNINLLSQIVRSIVATEAIIVSKLENATDKQVEEGIDISIPEERGLRLVQLIQEFIKMISEMITGKDKSEVTEEKDNIDDKVKELSEQAKDWRQKIVSQDDIKGKEPLIPY